MFTDTYQFGALATSPLPFEPLDRPITVDSVSLRGIFHRPIFLGLTAKNYAYFSSKVTPFDWTDHGSLHEFYSRRPLECLLKQHERAVAANTTFADNMRQVTMPFGVNALRPSPESVVLLKTALEQLNAG